MSQQSGLEVKMYLLENRKSNYIWAAILVAVAVIFLLLLIFFSSEGGTLIYTRSFLVLIALFLAWYNFYQARYVRLVLSKTGVEYLGLGYSVRVTWDQVECIGPVPGLAKPIDDGLILKQASVSKKWWFAATKPAIWRDNFISLLVFDKNWRQNEIGQFLQSHAPRLFSEKPTAKS